MHSMRIKSTEVQASADFKLFKNFSGLAFLYFPAAMALDNPPIKVLPLNQAHKNDNFLKLRLAECVFYVVYLVRKHLDNVKTDYFVNRTGGKVIFGGP